MFLPAFNDASGDGLGDIPGVVERLDYLERLSIDGIWLTPPYASPQEDSGYVVSDFRALHPPYGTFGDLGALIEGAHRRGLKVLLDLVLGHTSDQHPLFAQSASSRDNPRSDWYVWADPAADGGPPNNWISSFGGRAWRWEPRRAQYCYRPFLRSQPALNLANQQVMAEMLNIMRFWLDKGIDGFRIDAIQCLSFDRDLRSNPPARVSDNPSVGGGPNNPFRKQMHLFDRDVPEAIPILRQIRRIADEYAPQRVLIGELADVDSSRLAPKYTAGNDRLHAVYDFDLINRGNTLRDWTDMLDIRARCLVPGSSYNAFTNHDSERAVSNLMPGACAAGQSSAAAKLLLFLQVTLSGGAILYQGDELGLEQPELGPEDITDPWAKALWPDFAGRDGVRTPMPWDSTRPNCGFSRADPERAIPDRHREQAVDRQERDPGSVLHFTRELLRWRRDHPMLRTASETVLTDMPFPTLGFRRNKGAQILYGFANFGPKDVELPLPGEDLRIAFRTSDASVSRTGLSLGPLAAVALV